MIYKVSLVYQQVQDTCASVSRFSHAGLFADPMDCSPPGSSVHGILQARILEWGCHFLLRGMFPTQGLNPHFLCLLNCRRILYPRETRVRSLGWVDPLEKLPTPVFWAVESHRLYNPWGGKELDMTELLSPSLPTEQSGKPICMHMCVYFIDRFVFVQNQAVNKVHTTYMLITACKTLGKIHKKTIDGGYAGQ